MQAQDGNVFFLGNYTEATLHPNLADLASQIEYFLYRTLDEIGYITTSKSEER
jgi:hypothetical protein